MVKDVEIFIALFVLFITVVVIFNARWLIKNKVKKEVENKVVNGIKCVAFILCMACLIAIYYMR